MNYTGLNLGLGAFAKYQLDQNEKSKQEAKETEQRTYERNRQAVADQQNAGLYEDQRKISTQQFEQNKFTLGGLQRKENEEVKNQQNTEHLRSLYGMHADDNLDGMIDDINPRIQPITIRSGLNTPASTQQMKYVKNADGTVSLNVYDGADPTKLIRTQATGLTKDDLLNRGRAKYDPDGSMEAKFKNDYENAKAVRDTIVDDRKAKRDHDYKIEEFKEQGKNAQTLAGVNGFIGYQRDRANWDDRSTVERYKTANSPSTTKAGANAIPGFTWGGGVPSSGDMARLTFQLESNGQHFDANGQPLRSYDPKSSARGGGQFIQSTRDLMIKKYNIDPWSSADSALKATQLYQEDNTRLLNNDPKAGFVAHYAGPGAVQQWQAQAAKNDGSWQAWEKYIPAKYQQRAAQYDQVFSAQSPARSNQASDRDSALIPSTVAPLAKRIVESFKDYKGQDGNPLLNEVQVGGQLGNAANLLTKAYQSKNMQQKTQLLNDAGDIIDSIYVNTRMSPQQIRDARNSHIAQMAGEGDNIGGVYKKLGLREQQQIDTRTQQQASVSGVTNNPSFAREDKSTPPAQAKSIGKANLASTKAQVVDTQKLVTYIDGAPKPNGMTTENIQREAQMIQQALATNPPAASKAKLQARLSRLEPFMATNTGSVPSVVKGAKSVGSTIKSGFTLKIPTTAEIKARNAADAERRKAQEKKQLDAAVSLGLTMR